MSKAKKKVSKRANSSPTGAKKTAQASKDAPKTKKADTGQRRGPRAKRTSGLDAAVQVLGEAGEPMGCKVMVEKMLAEKLWQTKGKSPASTIYAAIIREIAAKGDKARFKKTDRGRFVLNK